MSEEKFKVNEDGIVTFDVSESNYKYVIGELNKHIKDLQKQLNQIQEEFLKYDWENANPNQLKGQVKELYEAIFKNK